MLEPATLTGTAYTVPALDSEPSSKRHHSAYGAQKILMTWPLIVYTCITEDYDWLLPPLFNADDVAFICFTDNPLLKAKGWDVRPIPRTIPPVAGPNANRFCKMFPWSVLPQHHWSLYIDANIRLLRDPRPVIASIEAKGRDMAVPFHARRETIWQEAQACIREGKVPPEQAERLLLQVERYRAEGLPENHGLTENGILFRSGRSDNLLRSMNDWWTEFETGVHRDQISLPYVLWKTGTPIEQLPFSARTKNPYFRLVPHRHGSDLQQYFFARKYHGIGWKILLKCMRTFNSAKRRIGY